MGLPCFRRSVALHCTVSVAVNEAHVAERTDTLQFALHVVGKYPFCLVSRHRTHRLLGLSRVRVHVLGDRGRKQH